MTEPPLCIDLLGNLSLRVRGERVDLPGSRKTRALLGYLSLQKRPRSRTKLCELLWPTPNDPRAALRWSLSKLRPLLDVDGRRLVADRSTVEITGMDGVVDVRIIESLMDRGIAEVSTDELESATKKFGGELLEGHELSDCYIFYDWLMARRESVRRTHRIILRELVRRYEGDRERALSIARRLLASDPLDESNHVQVVRLLGELGRPHEARQQVVHCRELFQSELGADPSHAFLQDTQAVVLVRAQNPIPHSEVESAPTAREGAGLFGRAEECAILEEYLSGVEPATIVPILLFEGEAGIGKTRLLDEVRRRSVPHTIRMIEGRSWEAEMVRPYAAWIDCFSELPHSDIPDHLREDLASLVPALSSGGKGSVDEARLFHSTLGLLDHLRPPSGALILAFDDLQWMDTSSVALLNFVTRQSRAKLGVVCAGRAGEFADSPAARALLKSWSREGALRRVEVGSLLDPDAAALARSVRGVTDVDGIVARCGGNPLYLIEVALSAEAGVSQHLQDVLEDRLQCLDEAARACAEWIAILGHEAPTRWLEALSGQSANDLVRSTTRLRHHGILVFRDQSCDFAHDLMRQATLGRLPAAQRSIMHRQVVRVLRSTEDVSGSLAADIAYHASRGGELALAAEVSVVAGQRALRLAAPEEAYALAQRGMRDLAKASGVPEELATRAALLRVMVHASLGRRDVTWLDAELRALARESRCDGVTVAEHTAYYLLSIVSEEAGDFDTAREHSLNAERAGRGGDDRTRLAALANTARCLVQLERDPRRARDLLGEAEALAGSLQERVLDIPWGRGLLGALEGDTATARGALEEGVSLARASNNHWAEFECLVGLSRLDLESENFDGVLGRDVELNEVAVRLGEGSELPFARVLKELASAAPRAKEPAALEESLEILRRADTKGRLAYALNMAAEHDLRRGEFGRAVARAREAREAAELVGRPVQMARSCAVWGLAEIALGDVVAARVQRDRVKADLSRLGANVGARAHLIRLEAALEDRTDERKRPLDTGQEQEP